MTLADNIPSSVLSKVIDVFNFYQSLSDVDITPVFVSFYNEYPVTIDGLTLLDTLKFRCLLKISMRNFVISQTRNNCAAN